MTQNYACRWSNEEELSSLTVGLDSSFLSVMIDARETRDTMMADTPNTFVQTLIDELDTVTMKITGVLFDLLVEDGPEVHTSCVVCEGNTKVSHVEVQCMECL